MKKVKGYYKRILMFLVGAVFLVGCTGFKESGNGIRRHGALYVEDGALKDDQGEITVLRGMSSHGIQWFPRYLNGAAMQTLKDYGANLQRISMYTDTSDGYIRNPEENLNYLYMGIESALAADMYVIVDWHILEDSNPNQYAEEALVFFEEISSHYGDHPGLLYEICNEPNGDTTWEQVVQYAKQVIPVIRNNAPNAVILVGTPNYCTEFDGPMQEPLQFDNIMYTMHRYIDTAQFDPCDTYLIDSVVSAGLPVFVSEWGTGKDEVQTGTSDQEMGIYQENAEPFLDYMEEHNISWAAWTLSNGDRKHGILRSECDKLSGWKEEDLTSFGKLVFSYFQ